MKSYIITKKNGELDWNKVPALSIDSCLWLADAGITAQARLCYDAEAIYVHFDAKEAQIRAEETGDVGMPCLDSCLEFFFRPTERMDYFNIEMNPNKLLFLGFGFEPLNTKIEAMAAMKIDMDMEKTRDLFKGEHTLEGIKQFFHTNYEGNLMMVPFSEPVLRQYHQDPRTTPVGKEILAILLDHVHYFSKMHLVFWDIRL